MRTPTHLPFIWITAVVVAGPLGGQEVAENVRQEVHLARRIVAVVDPGAPASLYVQGFPADGPVHVGDTLRLVSWPAEPGAEAPRTSRIPGTVRWSVEGRPEAVLVEPVNDTITMLIFVEPAPAHRPLVLRAEILPVRLPAPGRPAGTPSLP